MRQLGRDFGLAGWRIWLEILSIADRSDNEIDCTSDAGISRLTSAAETKNKVTRSVLDVLYKSGCIALEVQNKCDTSAIQVQQKCVTRVVNYGEYHKTREPIKVPSEPSEPSEPSDPTLTDTVVHEDSGSKREDKNPLSEPSGSDRDVCSDGVKKRRQPPAEPPPEAFAIAQYLSDKIITRIPNATPPSLKLGATAAKRLHEIDKKTWQEIRDMIDWCQADPFWQGNILSMDKLREKWTILSERRSKGFRLLKPGGRFVG